MYRFLLAVAAALFVALPGVARADERILHFLSDVRVGADGTLDVTETIRLRSEGESIVHGIYRDFPTTYRNTIGRQVRVGFEVLAVTRDGQPENWALSSLSNGVRVRVGSADVTLDPGEHVYRIHYTTSRQIGFFEDYDELYWNVTGNGWKFPIDLAEARITLPQEVRFGNRHVYTGPTGSTAENARVLSERPGTIDFRTTVPLGPYEGLTIAVAWPKGVVSSPPPQRQLGWWISDNGPPAVAGLGLLGILAYYFIAWRRAGRGPSAGPVVPIFAPPDGLSAAATRYISEMGSDSRTFAAALVDLGVRGKVRLVEGEKRLFGRPKTTVERTGESAGLPDAEGRMMQALFAGGDSILMDDVNHKRFSGAEQALARSFKDQYEGSLFVRNLSWSLRGLAATALAIWVVAVALILTDPPGTVSPAALPLAVATLATFLAAGLLLGAKSDSSTLRAFLRILGVLIGIAGIGFGAVTIGMALAGGRVLPLLIPLIALPVIISAFWWMAAPTRKGRGVLDRIAGFRQYLSITEEERLDRMHPPEKTPELFERYLPYAIAFEVENAWADRFAGVLAAAAAAGNTQAMGWYSGHSDPWSHPGDFADRVGSALSSTVSSASTAPGSSSGSGGGGSSGGGGGGGGGGGW